MDVGDRVVLLKGFGCSAHESIVNGRMLVDFPTGGEVATVEYVYPPSAFDGLLHQSVWIRFENGIKMCTWTGFLCLYEKAMTPAPVLFPVGPRRIQLEAC